MLRDMEHLNEVQFPKELQLGNGLYCSHHSITSMKCSSRRNCNVALVDPEVHLMDLNEVQFPKELQPEGGRAVDEDVGTSMKCSSRRNCNYACAPHGARLGRTSMKCSSRRNCNPLHFITTKSPTSPQ